MSAKWRRSKAWDDRFFPAWAWPAKFLLRALSSITLAVVLLTAVAIYGLLASVPIGLLALTPTYAIVGLTLLAALALVAGAPLWLLHRFVPMPSRALRSSAILLGGIALLAAGGWLWAETIWPALRYDASTGEGFRLFAGFVDEYSSTTIRRLPALEMTEGQFYGWWPLRAILLLFVVNMIVATARRIEFTFPNIGVLTVHTGIVILTLGSMHYNALKQEGDVLLINGEPGEPGPPARAFHDRTRVALWVNQNDRGWTQRVLQGVPRYNDYNLPNQQSLGALDIPATRTPGDPVDPDIDLRATGYGSYVELAEAWEPAPPAEDPEKNSPLIEVELVSSLPDASGSTKARPAGDFRLPAADPSRRAVVLGDALGVEHVPAEQTQRWEALTAELPENTNHALRARIAESGESVVRSVESGASLEAGGYRLRVKSLHDKPPFPIITKGYEDAQSSVAIVEVTTPTGQTYDRYVYHRFPAINQDILGVGPNGRPDRRDADPALRLDYIDASILQVYIRSDGAAAVRSPGGAMKTIEDFSTDDSIELAPGVDLRLKDRLPNARRVERPEPVPEDDRRGDFVGTHDKAALGVRVTLPHGWSRRVWLPFSKHMGAGLRNQRRVQLPDGRSLTLAFGRALRPLPGISLQLVDFEMIPYKHSDVPRDYVSQIKVTDMRTGESHTETVRLNHPLIHRVDFQWSEHRPALANALGAAISTIAPNHYKFSQAGWDAQGWRESKAEVEAERLDRPRAAYTILGVGNNPGIYIIATGGVMVALGIPWAFYVKPLILRRRKERLKRQAIETGRAAEAPHFTDEPAEPQPSRAEMTA